MIKNVKNVLIFTYKTLFFRWKYEDVIRGADWLVENLKRLRNLKAQEKQGKDQGQELVEDDRES